MTLLRLLLGHFRTFASWNFVFRTHLSSVPSTCHIRSISSSTYSRLKTDADGSTSPSSPSSSKMEDKFKKEVTDEERRMSDLKVKALSFLPSVDESTLDEQQLAIHNAHVHALKGGKMFYKDPASGFEVMTRLAHLNRGDCCGNACRHCPFGQAGAPEELRRNFNSAFYD